MSDNNKEAPKNDKEDPKKDPKKDKEDPNLTFHYTSKEGMKGIKESGQINVSVGTNDDVRHGANRVYLTTLHPEKTTPLEIAENNYDGSLDYAKSKLPLVEFAIGYDSKEIQAERAQSPRSIQTVKGDVPLEKAQVVYHQEGDRYQKLWSKSEEKKENKSHD